MRQTVLRTVKKIVSLNPAVFSVPLKIAGQRFNIPIIGRLGWENLLVRGRETWLDPMLERWNDESGAFVDVGCHMGQTLLKVKSLTKGQLYIGFEPNPTCLFYLSRLIEKSLLDKVVLFPCGLSDASGIKTLYGCKDTDSSASIIEGFREGMWYSNTKKVAVFKGDDVLSGIEAYKISFIKIGVEGAELDVIKGLIGTISVHRPTVVCEVLPFYSTERENGKFRLSRQEELESILNGLEYDIYKISRSGTVHRIDHIGVHAEVSESDYLFLPKENH
ncbi:MAG TPA: FkbM family methyltransferase [Deltaproteobacteria bacterium]|jgi:FkbM family methyltransferase|nr:FkbM family methyltransferase [Deltaproteobacteria bacterium]